MMFELFMEDQNSDECKTFINLMHRKYAAEIKATAISDEHMGTAVNEQINLTAAVPFDMVTALKGPLIPNVIMLGAKNDTAVLDMASVVSSTPCIITHCRKTGHFVMLIWMGTSLT